MDDHQIADAIRTARRAAGLSITELSHQVHTPASTISRIENGSSRPRRSTLLKINRVLKIFNMPRSYEVADPELQELFDFALGADEHAKAYLLTAVRRLRAIPEIDHLNKGVVTPPSGVVQSGKGQEGDEEIGAVEGGERTRGDVGASRRSSTRRAAR